MAGFRDRIRDSLTLLKSHCCMRIMHRRLLSSVIGATIVAAPSFIASAQPNPTATPCASPHVDARVVHSVEPEYPVSLRTRRISGTVQIKVTLNEAGAVLAVSVYKSSGEPDLDRAALEAARSSTYSAAMENCQAVGGAYLLRAVFEPPTLPDFCSIGISALIPTSDKNVWAVLLSRSFNGLGGVHLTLYSRDASYGADLKSVDFYKRVSFDEPLSDALRPFRAEVVFVRAAASETIDAASVEPIDPTLSPCVRGYQLSRAPRPDIRQQIDAAREAVAARLTSETSIVTARLVSALDAPSCAMPYRDATTTKPEQPDYPRAAREGGQTGTVIVSVGISETGAVSDAMVVSTSGSRYLDEAALAAARRSSYSPQIFRCQPVAGFYPFRADFRSQ